MRTSIVAKAERSDAAKRKQTTGRTDDGLPVHSFRSLLADLATYCRIQATTALNEKYLFTLQANPDPEPRLRTPRRQPRPYPVTNPSLSINNSEINGLQS